MSVPGHNNNNDGTLSGVGHNKNNDGRYSGVANSASTFYTAAHARQYNNSTFVANNSNNDKIKTLIAKANRLIAKAN
jgi:hypothetical protein